ncbi:hypothetical protein TNCV_2464361 [Trichonephila clavipes]|nr:hypothetical protein TNCV_2464361 [Trichonephila clavipes]
MAALIRCFNSAKSTGRERRNTLSCPFRNPSGRNHKLLDQEFQVAFGIVACCCVRLVQSIGKGDVHRGNLTSWLINVVLYHPIGE